MGEMDYEKLGSFPGGIEAFRELTDPAETVQELGKIAVEPKHTEELPPGLLPEDEEYLLAA